MKRFHAVGTDKEGRKYAGIFEAPDLGEARRMLRSEGYDIVSLEEVAEEPAAPVRRVKPAPASQAPAQGEAKKAFAGGPSAKSGGTGGALAAAAVVLAGLLAVIGYFALRGERLTLPVEESRIEDSSAAQEAQETPEPETSEEAPGFIPEAGEETAATSVEAEAVEVQVTEYRTES